ncbi:MAG: aspartate/glutamate racemase family protein [Burkholderiales bacterium]|nr:aspartate/glutamate racemase family protein [Burkholderiales bacterium]
MTHPYGYRARIGLIVPPTNTVNEAEWARLLPEGVTMHVARMPLHAQGDDEALWRALREDLARAAGDLAQARVNVIAYGCTAGSLTDPPTRIADYIRSLTGIPGVSTAQALIEGLAALGVARLAVATPYQEPVNAHEKAFLERAGFAVLHIGGLGIGIGAARGDERIVDVPLPRVEAHVLGCDRPTAQAMLISCTDLPTLPLITRLEAALGKPVVSSNTATLWAALRLAGVRDDIAAGGRLFRH